MRLECGLAHPTLTLLIGSFWPRHIVSRIMVDLPSLYSIIQSNPLSETATTFAICYSEKRHLDVKYVQESDSLALYVMDKISLRLGLNSAADLREGLGMRDSKPLY